MISLPSLVLHARPDGQFELRAGPYTAVLPALRSSIVFGGFAPPALEAVGRG